MHLIPQLPNEQRAKQVENSLDFVIIFFKGQYVQIIFYILYLYCIVFRYLSYYYDNPKCLA